ncbi:hypothetical protein J0895_12125 [Phormidium pseudopriestleyi FRX01]|uniref:Uncharacterized protein n=1 Tax=Phormidium pseudopriestleyi FRX01 TaxID=1759528 RepID=A0ABS3FRV3_9CYAN|nr:hypothetical protein [Phormidium pseudopriestleyi]MBO0349845.1 hypothetical protein [Phormidium pseudopriestleyi FRX01]
MGYSGFCRNYAARVAVDSAGVGEWVSRFTEAIATQSHPKHNHAKCYVPL